MVEGPGCALCAERLRARLRRGQRVRAARGGGAVRAQGQGRAQGRGGSCSGAGGPATGTGRGSCLGQRGPAVLLRGALGGESRQVWVRAGQEPLGCRARGWRPELRAGRLVPPVPRLPSSAGDGGCHPRILFILP